ncbi:unnamed protein product [Gadus morhua 'NCC']
MFLLFLRIGSGRCLPEVQSPNKLESLGMCFALLIARRWDYLTGEMQFTSEHEAVAVNLTGEMQFTPEHEAVAVNLVGGLVYCRFQKASMEKMTCILPLKAPLAIVKGEDDLYPALESTSRNSKRILRKRRPCQRWMPNRIHWLILLVTQVNAVFPVDQCLAQQ